MKKRILTMLLALVMAAGLLPGAALAAGVHVNVNSLEYRVERDNTVTITGCPTTAAGTLDIPATIEGLPVATIGQGAFYDCDKITYVTIPSGVKRLNLNAFYGCKSMYSVSIPSTVTEIGTGAFERCSSLLSVKLPEGLKKIEQWTFRYCESLEDIYIPNSVTYIGEQNFYGCSSLEHITLPSSLTAIKPFLFWKCWSLKSVKVPSSVQSIDGYAFCECTSLESVEIPNGIKIISDHAFQGCTSLKTITTPPSTEEIDYAAFEGCVSLTSATLNGTFTKLDALGLFGGSTALESVIVNAPITSLGSGTFTSNSPFAGCTSLKTVYLPGTLYEIKDLTFHETSALTDIYFGGSAYDWAGVGVDEGNEYLPGAKIHYIPFKDVKPGDWFYNSVDYVVEHHLMNGTASTTFAPNGVITRGEILTILARHAGINTDGGSTWYTKAVEWAKRTGISDGEEPLEQISRAELATLLYRCAKSPAVDTGLLKTWPDASAIPNGTAPGIAWCVKNGIINGTNDGKLLPLGTASRMEVAAMVQRYCEKLG